MNLLIEFPYHPDRFHIESVEQRAALVEAFKNAVEVKQVRVYSFDEHSGISAEDENGVDVREVKGGPQFFWLEVKP